VSKRGVAWTVSPYVVAAVCVRGGMKCVWCGIPMKANKGGRYKWRAEGCAGHTVDHYVSPWDLPPGMAHGADNLLPACVSCNSTRVHGREAMVARLGGRRQLRNAERRARRQLARPLARVGKRGWSEAVRQVAEAWYGGRLAWLRDWQRRKRKRRKAQMALELKEGRRAA